MVTMRPRFLKANATISVAGTFRICASSLTVMNSLTRTVLRSRSASAARAASISSRTPRRRSLELRRCGAPRMVAIVLEMFASTAS